MKKPLSQIKRRYAAICMAAFLAVLSPLAVLADEDTATIDVNNPVSQEMETPEEPATTTPQPTTPAAGASQARQPSAALQAANKAVQEGNAAVEGAKNEKGRIENSLEKAEDIKNDLVRDRNELNETVKDLDGKIQDVTTSLDDVTLLLEKKESELQEISARLIQTRQDAADQYENMKIRIKFMYEKGTMDFVQILLGAGSFSEMLNKAEYIEELSAYDRAMLEQYEQTKTELTELEDELGVQQQALVVTKSQVEEKKQEIEGLMSEKSKQLEEYNSEIKNKEAAIAEYEDMIKEQDAAIRELEKIAEEARKRQQAALAAENSVSGNSAVKYSGGRFSWPAPSYTRISDDYGSRIHPTLGVEKFHNGIDMAAPSGSPILAAADGEVIAADYSATMGNYIMIDHGSGIYTIYMHSSALYVSAGNKVKKGDQIAAVGSTGRSTGPHLHFSVRVNGGYVSPWNYLK